MNIALLGYGKMGKEIEKIALERSHRIALIIDENNPGDLAPANLKKADVAIDFSIPSTAFRHITVCFEAGIPIVCGTTGWLERFEEVKNLCAEKNATFFYASNYSIGVNILFRINQQLAKMMQKQAQYDVSIEEVHHTTKLDKPSGTAISLANDISGNCLRKSGWILDEKGSNDQISIQAVRRENVPGIHTITWESEVDILQLHHSAKSRKGFALGAVLAAEYIQNKKGIYSMNDLLQF